MAAGLLGFGAGLSHICHMLPPQMRIFQLNGESFVSSFCLLGATSERFMLKPLWHELYASTSTLELGAAPRPPEGCKPKSRSHRKGMYRRSRGCCCQYIFPSMGNDDRDLARTPGRIGSAGSLGVELSGRCHTCAPAWTKTLKRSGRGLSAARPGLRERTVGSLEQGQANTQMLPVACCIEQSENP